MLRVSLSSPLFRSSSPFISSSCTSIIHPLPFNPLFTRITRSTHGSIHCRHAHTTPQPSSDQPEVTPFDRKVGKMQRRYGLKGTSKALSMEREMWHLRQKKKETKKGDKAAKGDKRDKRDTEESASFNKAFKSTQISKQIVDFIEVNKLGRRRTKKPPKTDTKVIQYKKEHIPKLKFVAGAAKKSSIYPEDPNMLEVAFVGRSNVGKSTLINTFTSSGVARTSDTPGETRSINWYSWGGNMFIVDLPGYGFSFSSLEEKQGWLDLMQEYVTTRKTLKRVMILLDARHGVKSADLDMMNLLTAAKKNFQILLTKADRVQPDDLARRYTIVKQETKKFKYLVDPIVMVSARKRVGLDRLRREVERFKRRETATTERAIKAKSTNTADSKDSKKPTLKEQWRKDEARRKNMIANKMEDEQFEEEEEEPEVELDDSGKEFLPSQKTKSGPKSNKGKKRLKQGGKWLAEQSKLQEEEEE